MINKYVFTTHTQAIKNKQTKNKSFTLSWSFNNVIITFEKKNV